MARQKAINDGNLVLNRPGVFSEEENEIESGAWNVTRIKSEGKRKPDFPLCLSGLREWRTGACGGSSRSSRGRGSEEIFVVRFVLGAEVVVSSDEI